MSIVSERPHAAWINSREYPFNNHYLDVEGGRMHYIAEGGGDPILFVHGSPTWSYMWRNLIRDLSKDHLCVAPDHVGFGLSEKAKDWSFTPAAHCRNLTQLIQHLGLKNITLVMHDYGAPIAMSYATEHADNVKRLIVMNSWCWDISNDPVVSKLGKAASGALGKLMYVNMNAGLKLMKAMFADKTKFTENMQTAYSGPFEQKESRIAPMMMAKHLVDQGAWYDAQWSQREEICEKPLQLLWGMKDPTFGEKYLNKWWHEFPLAEVERLDDAGHLLMEEKPVETLRTIRRFLSAVPKPGGFLA